MKNKDDANREAAKNMLRKPQSAYLDIELKSKTKL